jgi:hypothetical protein
MAIGIAAKAVIGLVGLVVVPTGAIKTTDQVLQSGGFVPPIERIHANACDEADQATRLFTSGFAVEEWAGYEVDRVRGNCYDASPDARIHMLNVSTKTVKLGNASAELTILKVRFVATNRTAYIVANFYYTPAAEKNPGTV